MKIGILTLPLHTNYGGILQAYALQSYLKRRGHDVTLIDRRFNQGKLRRLGNQIKIHFFRHQNETGREKIRAAKIDFFIRNYIESKTPPAYSSNVFQRIIETNKFDAIVVGSDQSWRYKFIKAMLQDYFLGVESDRTFKKLSYAASFGKDSWEGDSNSITEIKRLLKVFDGISVRENTGVQMCEQLFGVSAEHHIDPVALLDVSDYQSLVEIENEPIHDGNLLVYMLGSGQDRILSIDRIQEQIGGTSFCIGKADSNDGSSNELVEYPTVTSWLKGFFDADYVLTDSFHGTMFSLINNKPFIVYGDSSRGITRLYSLLEKVKLSHRIVQSSNEISDSLIHEAIDWTHVNRVLSDERQKTDDYFSKHGL